MQITVARYAMVGITDGEKILGAPKPRSRSTGRLSLITAIRSVAGAQAGEHDDCAAPARAPQTCARTGNYEQREPAKVPFWITFLVSQYPR